MSQENVELVMRWYAFLPDLASADAAEDRVILDEAFRDYLRRARLALVVAGQAWLYG